MRRKARFAPPGELAIMDSISTSPLPPRGRSRLSSTGWWAVCALLLAAGPVAAQPTVNGLFYGDGDSSQYVLWNTSYYGSGLYIYYDAPTTTLRSDRWQGPV